MLWIIGLGVGDEKDISVRGVEACRKADRVFAEFYTARWAGDAGKLEKMIGKKIYVLQRKDLEEDSGNLVKEAAKKDVALLVPGDPLSATTHANLLMEAKGMGIGCRVVHSSSILTAVAETGLILYNFGRTATIVRPQKAYAPDSFYVTGAKNRKQGMHTLFLLDIDMDTGEAAGILLGLEKRLRKGLLDPGMKAVAASGLGSMGSRILYEKMEILQKKPLKPPAVVIIPGKLHFIEEEFLASL